MADKREPPVSDDDARIPMLPRAPEPPAIVHHAKRAKPLTLLPLVALIFYDVSGGPFGIEVSQPLIPRSHPPLLATHWILHPAALSCVAVLLAVRPACRSMSLGEQAQQHRLHPRPATTPRASAVRGGRAQCTQLTGTFDRLPGQFCPLLVRLSGHWASRCAVQDAVSSGGPLLAILGFLFLPLIWSVPEALITAELATAFPEDSGYVAWVTAAFGPYWGFQEGFWSWCAETP